MRTPLPQLQRLLLDILSPIRPVDPATVAQLADDEWETLLRMARHHRLRPMLHWHLTRERADLTAPRRFKEALAAGFERAAMRALRLQRELLLVHRHLEKAKIPHLALKGAFLAFYAYPHPALRPMRDLDLLVPETMALKAYEVLLDNGLTRPNKYYRGDLDAALEASHHLPPLYCASGQVSIELHTRFSRPDGTGVPDLAHDAGLWRRAVHQPIADRTLCYLAPTDLLLYLIQHAVHQHRLDNGPLVLSDLAYLLERHTIDWPLFWRRAQQHGQTRGALLLLKMVEHYFGGQPVEWTESVQTEHESAKAQAEKAAVLTLRRSAGRYDTLASRSGIAKKLGILFKHAFPSKREIAARYPVSEESRRIYLWYFARLWRLSTVHLPEYLAGRRADSNGNEADAILALDRWLRAAPQDGNAR